MAEKNVGIWIRVSHADQVKGESPEHHEKRARMYAESRGWTVQEVYRLDAMTGRSVMQYPETSAMLGHVKSGRISGLIFSKLARLARNTRELLEFSDIFREHGADLISLQEAIDTSTPAGRLFFTIIAAMAQWEREEIAERVAASVPVRAMLGKPLGGQAPFGYRWENKKLVPDPKEAPVRKLMYELFLEHRRKRTVARLLNESGYRTRNGGRFSDTTVKRLLQDPTAKGVRRANYTKSLGAKKHWRLKDRHDWVFTEIDPLITEELWEQVNAILEEQSRLKKPAPRKSSYLFTGFIYCACGQKMYVPSNTPKYVCYNCRNKVPIIDIEGVFQEQLKNFFFSPSEIERYLDEADHFIKDKLELLKVLESEEKEIRREKDRVYDLYMKEQLTPEGFGERYKPLEERQKQLTDEIPSLQGEIDFLKIQYLSSDEVLSEAQGLYARWPELSFEEKRKILETITDKIIIDKDEVEIHLSYLPSSSEIMATSQHNPKGSWRRPG